MCVLGPIHQRVYQHVACEITSHTSADLLTLFISFYTWPPMIKALREGRCAPSLPHELKTWQFHHLLAPSAAGSKRWLLTLNIHLFSSPVGVMVGESPNEVYEAIKQAFNLLVYAQEPVLPLASRFSGLQS